MKSKITSRTAGYVVGRAWERIAESNAQLEEVRQATRQTEVTIELAKTLIAESRTLLDSPPADDLPADGSTSDRA